MAGMSRQNIDTAGGTLVSPPVNTICYVEGSPGCVLGQTVTSHGIGSHSAATMTSASTVTFINNVGVVRAGDTASCGDIATGSSIVFAD